MKVLLLVDLQNDFMPGGALAVADGDLTIPVANRIMSSYNLVVATKDWHPENHSSFVDNNPGSKLFDIKNIDGLDQVMWPTHCVQDTLGAEFHKDLAVYKINGVFPKGTHAIVDSYSGFFDNGKRNKTDLDEYLKRNGATEIDIMGLALDYCVKFTALDAITCGYKVNLIVEGCRSVNMASGDKDRAIEEMKKAGITIDTSKY